MAGYGSLKKVKLGDLRHHCELQEDTSSSADDRGHYDPSWTFVANIWCAIRQLSAIELLNARQLSSEATHRIFTRHDSRITDDKRIVLGSRVFHIGAVDNVESDNRFVVLLCAESLR